MVCEKSNELMMRYMDGLLDAFDEMNLTKHIETCEVCREDFAVYKEMLEGFDLTDSSDTADTADICLIEAPDGFEAAVMAQIQDINIYFPEKVRNKGVILDNIIFVVWGLVVATFAAGLTLFLFNEQILAWLEYQGLAGLATALYPVSNFVIGLGTTAGNFFANIANLVLGAIGQYWLAATVAVAGLAGLAALTLYLAPQSARTRFHKRHKV